MNVASDPDNCDRSSRATNVTQKAGSITRARYYSNQQGRFTSVDPLGASASVLNPQSFNRYSYVNNNPINFVDGVVPKGISAVERGNGSDIPSVSGYREYSFKVPKWLMFPVNRITRCK